MRVDGSDQKEKGAENAPAKSLKELLNSDYVKTRFMEVMGEKATSFLASLLNAIQKNHELAKCESQSLLSAAMVAATLDLPIDSNLGFAAIIPYNCKIKTQKNGKEVEIWVTLAQFQIMYKGFIQLALRTGQYKTINVSPIYEDEFESYDIITGDIQIHPVAGGYRDQENMDKIIGYVAFFRLINGFERLEYWSISKLKAHGKKYSKSFDKNFSLWKKDPHVMYAKTPLKALLSRWGILSVTMQNAIAADQGSFKDWKKPIDSENINYIDSNLVTEEAADVTVTVEVEAAQPENNQEKQDNESTENKDAASEKPEETTTIPANKNDNGLFPEDEAAALEEQFEQQQAGFNYPDFGG